MNTYRRVHPVEILLALAVMLLAAMLAWQVAATAQGPSSGSFPTPPADDGGWQDCITFLAEDGTEWIYSCVWPVDGGDPSGTIFEDDPRWDCETMGNRVCGPPATV